LDQVKNKLISADIISQYKMSKSDFTRVRKQSFHGTIVLIINFLTKSLPVEIQNFIGFIKQNIQEKEVKDFTTSAFVQYRNKIKPEVFKYLSDNLIQEFYTDNDESINLWNGFRLLAVDGSIVNLPDNKPLELIYGRTYNKSGTGVIQARASVLYDVLNKFVIDGCLSPLSTGERVLAINHLAFSKTRDLIIYDRGYPSFNLVYEHFERRIDFLMRVQTSFNKITREFYESRLESNIVKICPDKKTKHINKVYSKDTFQEVRLVRVKLPNGEIEILMSSLLDSQKYPNSIFKDLYFLRWGVETFYDELKNKIKAEHFSGYSNQSILQDFYAALFISNVQSLIVGEINNELALKSEKTKYQYKVNNNLSYGFMKNRIITLFFSDKPMEVIVSELKDLFKKHTIPIRPNRKFKRDIDKYKLRRRPKVLKNNKDAF